MAKVQHNTNFVAVHSWVRVARWVLDGNTSTNFSLRCCTQNVIYQRFIYLHNIRCRATQRFFFFGERISSLPKFACEITGYPFCSIQYIAFQPLPLSSISRYEEKCFVCPSSELLWLCLSHNIIASSSSYCCSKLT